MPECIGGGFRIFCIPKPDMKKYFLLVSLAFFTAAILAFTTRPAKQVNQSLLYKIPVRSCSPDWNAVAQWLEETDMPPVPGSGTHKWTISTMHDSAQFYFNQGMNMYYSFHIIEAMASFKKASRFDPSSAMCMWAQALAYGPNINDLGYAASPEALAAAKKSVDLSENCTPEEKLLIRAQQARYSEDSTVRRSDLNKIYTGMMRDAYEKFPASTDIAALYADAMMLEHPWDLWMIDGTPKPWTPLIREVLEKLLTKNPNHPGANHYYIHVMEPSPFAAKAIPSADRLGRITPALSHTVHMPSHIYLRAGFYEKGVKVNEDAVKSYNKIKQVFSPVAAADFLYLIHNLHMQSNNAMMQGNIGVSVSSADATRKSIPADYLAIPGAMGNYIQYIYMTPAIVNVRFGNWEKILNEPAPANNLIYARILHHFSRGMAYSRRPKAKDADDELEAMRTLMKEPGLAEPMSPFSAAIEGAKVAEHILAGSIALKKENYEDAIRHFREAVDTEEKMVYNEPRDWMLNPRHYLGDALLHAGRAEVALAVFEKDLDNNHENGWALFGCYLAIKAQNNKPEADKYLTRYRIAFAKSDIKLNSSVF